MLEQDVDDVRVALLRGLVQRRVAVLWRTVVVGPAPDLQRERKIRYGFIARLECSGVISVTATSTSRAQAIPPPQPPQYRGLQAHATMTG
ncbi:hypothetical protein AAY473_036782 [Plecturocebus cupreus]